ncbi:MAG: carbohydrate porin [Colwellia sp.]
MTKAFPLLLITCTSSLSVANDTQILTDKIKQLEIEIQQIKNTLSTEQEVEEEVLIVEESKGIELGGAVRFQYVLDELNKDNGGDLDFDIFRLDLDGEIGGVILSAQYRWFQYMNVIHHAWVGYDFNDEWQGQVGITRVPFGNLDYNSHNYFFSSNYYVGLEDDYDAGIKFIRVSDQHDIRFAFFLTDEMGGIDGFVDNRSDRYSYDIVGIRSVGEGIYDEPSEEAAEQNTLSFRYAYKLPNMEIGASWLSGDIAGKNDSLGSRSAYAVHGDAQFNAWNIKLQYTRFEYDLDSTETAIAVGAYSFYDTIPTESSLYTANVAYLLDVKLGPISSLNFYNNYSLMTDKSGDFNNDTIMNVSGVAISAGGLYTYVDLVNAKNQPFINGTMAGDDDEWQTRFNINFGYYF